MSEPQHVPLDSVPGVPPHVAERFKFNGIHTANHFMEIASMPGGLDMLHAQLADTGLTRAEADACIAAVRGSLDPAALEAASRPLDVSQFGLGALDPQKRGR